VTIPPRRLPLVGTAADRALWRITTYTTGLGERRGIDWLTYSPLQLLAYHRLAALDAGAVMRAFGRVFPEARRYVDVGAGSGAHAAEAQRLGVDVVAGEQSRSGRLLARAQRVRTVALDLSREPPMNAPGPFDLAYSIEVAEHVPDGLGERLVRLLLELSATVVFTAAHPGQGGLGHVNERPPGHWIARFEANGGAYDSRRTEELREALVSEGVQAPWLAENAMVFSATTLSPDSD
jgi:SAM-dependent methyltransferase